MATERDAAQVALLACDAQQSVLAAVSQGGRDDAVYAPYGHRQPRQHGAQQAFNGELPDPSTGHYLLGNGYRGYNPVLMRFNQPDSWSPFGAGGLNSYVYCLGNPINRRDPSGHMALDLEAQKPQEDSGGSSPLPWILVGLTVLSVLGVGGMFKWKRSELARRRASERPGRISSRPPSPEALDLTTTTRTLSPQPAASSPIVPAHNWPPQTTPLDLTTTRPPQPPLSASNIPVNARWSNPPLPSSSYSAVFPSPYPSSRSSSSSSSSPSRSRSPSPASVRIRIWRNEE